VYNYVYGSVDDTVLRCEINLERLVMLLYYRQIGRHRNVALR